MNAMRNQIDLGLIHVATRMVSSISRSRSRLVLTEETHAVSFQLDPLFSMQ
jgi:hypothetical protein